MPTPSVQLATIASLIVQFITGLIGSYGLTLPIQAKDAILKQVLGLEMLVQGIEFIFYFTFLGAPNILTLTQQRYHDWFLSTPVMLFTSSLYFFYVNFMENGQVQTDMNTFIADNKSTIALFVILNALMLLFGYLGELGLMDKMLSFWLGTAALIGSFGTIYEHFAKFGPETKRLFWIMFGIWALYGFAFLIGPVPKNISYTVLDLFAKNFFGLFLTYKLAQKVV